MRIISANLQHGTPAQGVEPSQDCWQVLAKQFASYHADAICLQEVDFYQLHTGFTNQTRALAGALSQETGITWNYRFLGFFAGQVVLGVRLPVALPKSVKTNLFNPFRADRPLIGGYGLGILTPHPVRRWVSAKLGAAQPRISINGWDMRKWSFYGGQTRSILGAEVLTKQGSFLLGCTHLELGSTTARNQLRRSWQGLCALAGIATPVLAGDFNLRSDAVRDLFPYLTIADALTYPANQPSFQIDHVLAPPHCQVVSTENIKMSISDHRALFVDLDS